MSESLPSLGSSGLCTRVGLILGRVTDPIGFEAQTLVVLRLYPCVGRHQHCKQFPTNTAWDCNRDTVCRSNITRTARANKIDPSAVWGCLGIH